tara:strand:+ start:436 stop:564 length:129 start_codon:yes stop_codon:yes gene_type:complete
MKKKDQQLINSIFEKLKIHENAGIKVKRKDVEDLFYLLINKN